MVNFNLETPVCMFDGELNTWAEVAAFEPDWTGTLSLLWSSNSETMEWEDFAPLVDELRLGNLTHYNGGAGGIVTICTQASRDSAVLASKR